jgi:hypothetical protein
MVGEVLNEDGKRVEHIFPVARLLFEWSLHLNRLGGLVWQIFL